MIYHFFTKKNRCQYRIYKQAYYNTRICPSIFLIQKNVFYRNDGFNSLNKDEKYVPNANILQHFIKRFKNSDNNYLNNIHFTIPSRYDVSNQNKNIIQYWMTRTKFNTNYIKYDLYDSYHINNFYYFNKKKIESENNMLICKLPVTNNNFFKQKKTIFLNQYKSQFHLKSTIDNHNTEMGTQKKSYHCSHINKIFPDINLLIDHVQNNTIDSIKFKKISRLIEKKLFEYGISVNVRTIISGPVVTRFDLTLSAGIKSARITSLSRDLARSLSVASIHVLEVIPGTPYVGLEIPNVKRDVVYLKDIINSNKFKKHNSPLTLVLGKDVTGQPVIEDLRCMPHLLIAGTTGSGKSIGINIIIISILYKATPEDVRFVMIDPKILELSIYENIPHLLKKVVTNTEDAESTLQWCVQEMERRYQLMSIMGVRNLESYNNHIDQLNLQKDITNYSEKLFNKHYSNDVVYCSKKFKKLPYIIIIIDEFSDLMITTTKKVEVLIIRLTQKARASGMHIILATQRPSVDVITGVIKANIPARIAFTVSSKIDSRTILGQSGAESLLGMGDMLYLPPNSAIPIRIHGAYITDTEIYSVINFWKEQTTKYIQLNK